MSRQPKIITTEKVMKAIDKGNTEFEKRLVGRVILARDADETAYSPEREKISKRQRLRSIPLFDLSDLGYKHVIYVGRSTQCDLRPYLGRKNIKLDQDTPLEHGYVYAQGLEERSKDEEFSETNSRIRFAAFEPTYDNDGRRFSPPKAGQAAIIEWIPGECETSYMGFCPVNGEPRYKVFFLPKSLLELDHESRRLGRKKKKKE